MKPTLENTRELKWFEIVQLDDFIFLDGVYSRQVEVMREYHTRERQVYTGCQELVSDSGFTYKKTIRRSFPNSILYFLEGV